MPVQQKPVQFNPKMSTYITLCPFVLLALVPSVVYSTIPTRNNDIVIATREMQRANYFTFVMLINMAPPDLFQGNLTFLMPNDRTLSRTTIPENTVIDFLLRHSVPSPLLFDHLLHIPTNSMIPTSDPDLMLKISNDGRRRFFLSNVRVVSPNICTAGYSIRCHGVDGVVQPEASPYRNPTLPVPACSNDTAPPVHVAPSGAPPGYRTGIIPSAAPPLPDMDVHRPKKSDGSGSLCRGRPLIELAVTLFMVLLVTLEFHV